MNRNYLKLGASTLAIIVGAGTAAYAQTSAAPIEQVIVTGSRVIANGNDMPTPVTVVSPAELTSTAPASVMDALQELPVFAGGRSPQTNVGNSSQNQASHQFNIRNVGITRTLVLYDGRRIASTSPTGEVDADIIPQMLLQRVDVVTGGVSAVYGSDAVAGVVNFITDNKFNGIKGNVQGGVSEYGDSVEERAGVAAGMSVLDGKGHVEGSVEFYNNDGVTGKQKFSRDWETLTKSAQGGGTLANPNVLVSYTRLASSSYSGYITTGNPATNPFRDMEFAGANNALVPFVHGTPSGTSLVEVGGDGIYYQEASLVATTRQGQVFGRFDYDFSDDMSGFVEVTGTKIGNTNVHQTNEYRNVTLSATDAFLTAAQQSTLAAAKVTSFIFSKGMLQAPPLQSRSMTTSGLFEAGLNGKVFGNYRWDLSFVHNENRQYTHNPANPSTQKSFAALDAVKDPATGNIVCSVTLTNPTLYPGCVPLNLFGNGSETPAMLNYVLDDTHFNAITTLDDVGGSVSGSPFDGWAGPVQVALSGEYRQTRLNVKSNAQASDHANCTGLRFNCNTGTFLYISNVVSNTRNNPEQSVGEGAVEIGVPLLKDVLFAQDLTMDLAGRYTDYDTSGAASTWKVGLDWHINDEVTVRVVQSRDIRAPNLNDLFSPTLINPAGTTDFHVLTNGAPTQLQAPFITLSNPALKPEKALTDTAGIVYRPSWLDNFSISVDYYHIKIANAITALQGQNQAIQQICEASNGASSYCSLALRPLPFSDHTIANLTTGFLSQPQNAQTLVTEGTDIEMNYQTDFGPGHLALRSLTSYQPTLKTVQFIGAPVLNTANAPGQAGVRSTLFVKYNWDAWTFNVQERIRGGSSLNSNRSIIYASSFPYPALALWTNLNVSYDWETAPFVPMQISLAVENVFDRPPTLVGGGATVPGLFPGQFGGDDTIGRYFTLGLKFNLD